MNIIIEHFRTFEPSLQAITTAQISRCAFRFPSHLFNPYDVLDYPFEIIMSKCDHTRPPILPPIFQTTLCPQYIYSARIIFYRSICIAWWVQPNAPIKNSIVENNLCHFVTFGLPWQPSGSLFVSWTFDKIHSPHFLSKELDFNLFLFGLASKYNYICVLVINSRFPYHGYKVI